MVIEDSYVTKEERGKELKDKILNIDKEQKSNSRNPRQEISWPRQLQRYHCHTLTPIHQTTTRQPQPVVSCSSTGGRANAF
jgi:hypothetical protein